MILMCSFIRSFHYQIAVVSKVNKKRRAKPVVDIQPTLVTLLPKSPTFGIAAIIIREALLDRRNKEPTDETTVFRRMLTGFHPITGDQTRLEPNQMNPICADLRGFRLLKEVLPFHHLTRVTGLASLLVFMGMGQCSLTSEFLMRMKQRLTMFHFTSLDDCVERFIAILLHFEPKTVE
ncbi:hypothetical protein B0H13DRAFT_1859286 [Mycena leptocephala]|nr:hypothetical protein B0H13DRAFT_1859286 [Mycena leptocephala]